MTGLGKFGGRGPLLVALITQGAAVLIALAAIQGYHAATGEDLPTWTKIAIACAVAGGGALALRAAPGWAAFMAALPALFIGLLWLDPPIWLPPLILALLVLAMRNSLGDRVPLYLSNRPTLDALTNLLPADKPIRTVDLGCGFAAAPLAWARANAHPDSEFLGVENAPIPYMVAKCRVALAGDRRITIAWRSIWDVDVSGFDLVYVFLSPHPMPALFQKAATEAKRGALLVSNSFSVPGHAPDRTLPLAAGRSTGLLIWEMPGPGGVEGWTGSGDSE